MAESSSYRCRTCKSASDSPRNLVVFIDGTSNKPGDKNTNVVKFHNAVNESLKGSELEQRKHYLKGIGAYELDPNLGWLSRKHWAIRSGLEQAFARNAGENIKDAYRWLTERYQEGDQIYLFGFSRGGFQVRALASMVHEVGLVREKAEIESAYNHYKAIDPYNPETRKQAVQFKKMYCWQGVRIHFVGVWDTVSSLGFTKKDVHVTSSGSVTNACHFRHALALDECRVKFMPEYFLEMNACGSRNTQREDIGDVKEVWFAGFHADVGGADRGLNKQVYAHLEGDDSQSHSVHAGNVPLLWMRREAADKGLVFKPTEFGWDPEDVDFGTTDSMPPKSIWRAFEYLPIRHQVSFGGTGEHGRRWHRSDPRSVIPGQQIHTSILSGYMYTPRATLRNGVCIPGVKQNSLEGLWATELPGEEATARLLSSFLRDQHQTLECLGKVLFLLDSKLGSGQIQSVPQPRWSEEDILGRSDFAKFSLTVVCDATSKFTTSEVLVTSAKESLSTILSNPNHGLDDPIFHGTLNVLRFLTKHQTLRQRFCSDKVIVALVRLLERAAKCHAESSFALVTDSLCNLICDNSLRGKVLEQLSTADGTETTQSKLEVALEVKSPNQLVAILKMIATLSLFEPGVCRGLKDKILELTKKGEVHVGPAAIEALIALKAPLTHDIHMSNILGYLCNTLPRLDADGGSATSAEDINDLPSVLLFNGFGPLDEEVVKKLVSIIKSRNARERTAATLSVVKLCGNATIRKSFTQNNVLDIFIRQLEKRRTSLLGAYALSMCLRYKDMWSSDDFPRAAQLIVTMFNNGWFDDAVGQVEGCKILRGLMASDDLRRHINTSNMCTTLVGKLEVGKRHEVRMSLLGLDIIGSEEPLELAEIVRNNIKRLEDRDKNVQTKGVKVLSHLAQTAAGEQAIKPHLIEIVNMMLRPSMPRGQLFGPAAALYDLSKNETLREQIRSSPEFGDLKVHLRGTVPHAKAG